MKSKNSCFVPGCKAGYSSTRKFNKLHGLKNASLFKAPKDKTIFNKWKRAIPRADKELSENDVVCEVHFSQSDIEKCFETKISDQEINKIERGRPKLKCNAVPCIFPNLPHYLSNPKPERKPPTIRKIPVQVEQKQNEVNAIVSNAVTVDIGESETGNNGMENLEKSWFQSLKGNFDQLLLPTMKWTKAQLHHSNDLVFAEWNDDYQVEKQVVLHSDMSVQVFFGKSEIFGNSIKRNIMHLEEITEILKIVNDFVSCRGIEIAKSHSCLGIAQSRKPGQRGILANKCANCQQVFRTRIKKDKLPNVLKKHEKLRGVVKCIKRKNTRLKQRVTKLSQEINALKNKFASVKEEVIEEAIRDMPSSQQEAVRTCFATANIKNTKNRRYSTAWIYDCLLIRIKSRTTYEHLRKVNLLPLPCVETLNRYIKRINGSYGFQSRTFYLLKKKSELMPESDRRGTLLIDEMKLSENYTFDRTTLKVNGFTNLGDYTPKHQKNKAGDHALVMMFQPFRGSWIQSIASFLSIGCASSTVLEHLIIEGIILLEKSGFYVDVVTTDGASWNRSMWKKFNITEKELSCQHPYEETRRLWFCSDFPHLVKNFRNFITKRPETWTPDGIVKLIHWSTIVEMDRPKGLNLKLCPKLCQDDIQPKHYQKMNVGRAYRFFSEKTEAAMKIYKDQNLNLEDCEPTVILINKLSLLIKIMSSRTPENSLRPDSVETQILLEFVEYLDNWRNLAVANEYYFLSENTFLGFIVTLKSTVEILSFLCNFCHYEYLMTARLNQDSLERFFGMMRGACGAHDHPDSNLFIQIFKLISTYSLIKPPRGSNVDSDEIFSCLINTNEIVTLSNENVTQFQKNLDTVMDNCIWFNDVSFPAESLQNDHDYNTEESSDFVIAYVAGYMARKSHRFTKCNECLDCLKSAEPKFRDKFTQLLSKGYLTYPSDALFYLVRTLESSFLEIVTSSSEINSNIILEVMQNLEDKQLTLIGCKVYGVGLTEAVIRFFIITRMHFLCRTLNEARKLKKEKTRKLRKE